MKWCSSGLFVIILFKEDFKLFASNWIKFWPFDWSRVEKVGFTRIESTAPVRFKLSWLWLSFKYLIADVAKSYSSYIYGPMHSNSTRNYNHWILVASEGLNRVIYKTIYGFTDFQGEGSTLKCILFNITGLNKFLHL